MVMGRRDLPAEAREEYGAGGKSCGEALLEFDVAVYIWCTAIQGECCAEMANKGIARGALAFVRDLPLD